MPIATGERLTTKYEFARVLETGAASILQMNLGRVGGILEAKKIAAMAEAHYAQIAPHLYCGPVVGAANIQLAACSPNFLILESIERWDGFHAEILKKPIRWEDGYVIPPDEPGLGVELDEEVAARPSLGGDGAASRAEVRAGRGAGLTVFSPQCCGPISQFRSRRTRHGCADWRPTGGPRRSATDIAPPPRCAPRPVRRRTLGYLSTRSAGDCRSRTVGWLPSSSNSANRAFAFFG